MLSQNIPLLHTHRSPRHRKCPEDYPWVLVETMGDSPANCRLKLSGGQQAKRHRAVCNRGHGNFSSVTRFRINGTVFERPHLRHQYEGSVRATQPQRSVCGSLLNHLLPTCLPAEGPPTCAKPRNAAPRASSLTSAENARCHGRRRSISNEHSPIHPLKYRFWNPQRGVSAAAPARRLAAYVKYTRFVAKHFG